MNKRFPSASWEHQVGGVPAQWGTGHGLSALMTVSASEWGMYVSDSSTHPERFHSVVQDVKSESEEDKECLGRGPMIGQGELSLDHGAASFQPPHITEGLVSPQPCSRFSSFWNLPFTGHEPPHP